MGSSYFGDPNFLGGGNNDQRSTSSGSGGGGNNTSSRKGKKGSSSDKPKQPQRGLGVAQLEKIRLHSQLGGGCTYLPAAAPPSLHHHNNPYSSTNNLISQEDIRLQTPYSSSPSFSYSSSSSSSFGFPVQQSFMMGLGDNGHIRYPDSQPSTTSRWHPGNAVLESQHFPHPSITRHFLNQEDLLEKRRKKDRSDSMGSSSQHSDSSGNNQELDLELRLSL